MPMPVKSTPAGEVCRIRLRPAAPVRQFRRWALAAVTALAVAAQSAPVRSQQGRALPIIRDAEIEQLLRDYTAPIFKAAGIRSSSAKVVIVGDRTFNAFVANGQKIFVNVGAIMEARTPNEIIGVLAHESGHIAGGHLARLRLELANATIFAVAGMLMGGAAVAASARSRNVGSSGAGPMGAILGPQEMAMRSLLAYQRSEEQAADIAAMKYLDSTGQSAKGLLATLERFQNDSLFKTASIDPYLLSHPLPRERISNLQQIARKSPHWNAVDSPALQLRHDMARAKLVGFTANAGEASRRYAMSDNSMPARYARAISAYRFGRLDDALTQVGALIAAQPNNPWFQELRGQFLLESGRPDQAIEPLRRANALAPNATPIQVLLGHALLSSNNPKNVDQAITILTRVTQRENDYPEAFQYLAMAHERKGNQPQAMIAAAQGLMLMGRFVEARTQADRVKKLVPERSPIWLKADDIMTYRPPR
ncbi:MAG: M48 family metalloprotease [Beijerinckiaceae bacterium]